MGLLTPTYDGKTRPPSATGSFINLVLAIAMLIFIAIAVGSGGGATLVNIFGFMKQVPGWIWGLLIVIFVFNKWGRR
jgi:hypothetical protein